MQSSNESNMNFSPAQNIGKREDMDLNNDVDEKFSFNTVPPHLYVAPFDSLIQSPSRAQQSTYKTKLCRNYQQFNNCFYNGQCLFAHGYEDLVPHVREVLFDSSPSPATATPPALVPVYHPLLTIAQNPQQQFTLMTSQLSSSSSIQQHLTMMDRQIKYKTQMCNKVPNCPYGSQCLFAHSEKDLRKPQQHRLYKTARCNNFDRSGFCPFGDKCHYIHDESPIINLARSRRDLDLYQTLPKFTVNAPNSREQLMIKGEMPKGGYLLNDEITPLHERSREQTVTSMMQTLSILTPSAKNSPRLLKSITSASGNSGNNDNQDIDWAPAGQDDFSNESSKDQLDALLYKSDSGSQHHDNHQ